MHNQELSGYWPESILSPKPIRFEITINGHELVAVPKAEWKEVFLASR